MRIPILEIIFICFVCFANIVSAQTTAATPKLNIPIDFERLVKSLKSRNAPPRIIGASDVRFGPDFDFSEQRRIAKALNTLQEYAEDCWPVLVSHLANAEYSITLEFGDQVKNLTIGKVCEQIIRSCLYEFHDRCAPFISESDVLNSDLKDPQLLELPGLQTWLEQRQKKGLLELQVELCQNLKKRIAGLKLDEATKMRLNIFVDEQLSHMQKRGYPETGSRFIPNHEVSWFFTRKDISQ